MIFINQAIFINVFLIVTGDKIYLGEIMSASNVLKFIKEKEAEFVDLRFTDPRGKLQHLTMDSTIVDEEMLNEGVFFDG